MIKLLLENKQEEVINGYDLREDRRTDGVREDVGC